MYVYICIYKDKDKEKDKDKDKEAPGGNSPDRTPSPTLQGAYTYMYI